MPRRLTFVQAAEKILRQTKSSMKAEEIVEQAIRQKILFTESVDRAATMRYSLDNIIRSGKLESSNLTKVGPNLWSLKELVSIDFNPLHNGGFEIGKTYTRGGISAYFETDDANVNTGIFSPKGFNIVILFVTENKTKDRTPYKDRLYGEILEWDGQTSGRKDYLIKEHKSRGLSLLVFYRKSRSSYKNYAFEYLGTATYLKSSGRSPTHFWLRLEAFQNSISDPEPNGYSEGNQYTVTCSHYERNPKARLDTIKTQGLTCRICNFNFEDYYGSRGVGYIEVHHIIPLSVTKIERLTNPEIDLIVVCSNCHRMLHRIRGNTLLPEVLKSMISEVHNNS